MDNFCLLLYKVTEVEHFDYNVFPPKRTVNRHNIQDCYLFYNAFLRYTSIIQRKMLGIFKPPTRKFCIKVHFPLTIK